MKHNASQLLETLKAIGAVKLVPIAVPDFTTNVSAINVESVVFFDEHARAGRMKEARNGGRPSGRLIPAVDLRSQRVRMMMMRNSRRRQRTSTSTSSPRTRAPAAGLRHRPRPRASRLP